jgi:hypothetical protein
MNGFTVSGSWFLLFMAHSRIRPLRSLSAVGGTRVPQGGLSLPHSASQITPLLSQRSDRKEMALLLVKGGTDGHLSSKVLLPVPDTDTRGALNTDATAFHRPLPGPLT